MPTARNLLLSSGVADACAEALKRSIDNWGQTPPILQVADDDGAARGMGVYKLWNHHVRTLLFNCKAVVFYEKSRHPFFGVARQLGIRVKHVDDHYRSQMNDTEQARQLSAQLPLKGFYGPISDPTGMWVSLGFVWNTGGEGGVYLPERPNNRVALANLGDAGYPFWPCAVRWVFNSDGPSGVCLR